MNVHHQSVVRRVAFACLIAITICNTAWAAAPSLALVLPGGSSTSATIVQGSPSVTLGLRVDTGGQAVGSLLYHIVTDPTGAVTYAANPIIALGTPFTTADLSAGLSPTPGATVTGGPTGSTQWFKSTTGDYASFAGEIAWYTFNTSAMPVGTFQFTPIGDEFANDATATSPIDTFGTAGSFALTVTAVPEPTTGMTVAGLGLLIGVLRVRNFGSAA